MHQLDTNNYKKFRIKFVIEPSLLVEKLFTDKKKRIK